MKKYILVAIFSVSFSALSYSNNAFIGVNASYLYTTFFHSIARRNPPEPDVAAIDNAYSTAFGLFAGYRWYFNRFGLAPELFYNDDNASHTFVGRVSNSTKTLKYDYGMKLLPSYLVANKVALNAILGISYGSFRFNTTGNNIFSNQYTEPGYILGAGINYQFYRHLAATLSYEFTRYRGKNNISGDNDFYQRRGYVRTNRTLLGLEYQF